MIRQAIFIASLLACWVISLEGSELPAQPPAKTSPWIVVPDLPKPPLPPVPPPDPTAVPKLQADELYVLDASEPCFLLASPGGVVTVTQEVGPIKVRGKFVGGSGKPETRTFTGKTVFLVEAASTGRVELIVVKSGATSAADVFRQLLDANVGPQPPPVPPVPPTPPDPPKPPDPPAPIPEKGLRVLLLYETKESAKLSPGHRETLFAAKVRQRLNEVCVSENGWPGYRIYDPDQSMIGESKLWQDVMKRKRKSLPWLIISNGQTGFEGSLPEGADKFLELLKKYER